MARIKNVLAACCAVVVLVLSSQSVWPQSGRTIHLIVPVPPGASTDAVARLMAEQIGRAQGVTIVVENRPGASGMIGTEAVSRAAPDGNTLLMTANTYLIDAQTRKANYHPVTAFDPICYLVQSPAVFVVNSASPYRTLAELVAAARAKPAELSIASVGPQTTQHIGIERLKQLATANLTYVPYPGGATTLNALLGAHVTSAVLNWSEVGEQVNAGKVRALATMALQRIEPMPDLPTVAESGYRDFETDVWFGVVAPAKTPKETVSQLIDWFRTALLAPEVKSKLTAQALYPNPRCGAALKARRSLELSSRTRSESRRIAPSTHHTRQIARGSPGHVNAMVPTPANLFRWPRLMRRRC